MPPRFDSAAWQPDGLRLSLTGPADWPVRVQRSGDLVTWQDWQSVTTRGDLPVELTDLETSSQPRRFHRAITP